MWIIDLVKAIASSLNELRVRPNPYLSQTSPTLVYVFRTCSNHASTSSISLAVSVSRLSFRISSMRLRNLGTGDAINFSFMTVGGIEGLVGLSLSL